MAGGFLSRGRSNGFSFATTVGDLPTLLANTLIIAGLSVVISMGIGIPAAWALARRRVRVRGLLLLLLLVPRMIPPMTVGLGISREFYILGLVDTHFGIAVAHSILVVPLVILVMSAAFEGLDDHLLEAARVCGANGVQVFWHVVGPLVLPGLLAATLFAFVTSLNEFTLTLLTYGPRTLTLTIQTYIEIDKGFREIASAISVFSLGTLTSPAHCHTKVHKARKDNWWSEGFCNGWSLPIENAHKRIAVTNGVEHADRRHGAQLWRRVEPSEKSFYL